MLKHVSERVEKFNVRCRNVCGYAIVWLLNFKVLFYVDGTTFWKPRTSGLCYAGGWPISKRNHANTIVRFAQCYNESVCGIESDGDTRSLHRLERPGLWQTSVCCHHSTSSTEGGFLRQIDLLWDQIGKGIFHRREHNNWLCTFPGDVVIVWQKTLDIPGTRICMFTLYSHRTLNYTIAVTFT